MDWVQADHHRRHRFADHDLAGSERRHEKLVESPLLALARDRHGGQHHGHHHRDRADQRWNHVPARLEAGIVPGAGRHPDRGTGKPARQPPFLAEHGEYRVHVTLRGPGRVRVAAVGDDLDRRRRPGQQIALKIPVDHDDEHRAAIVHIGGRLSGLIESRHAGENPRAIEPRHQCLGDCAAVMIDQCVRHVVEVIGGRVTEDQALENWR